MSSLVATVSAPRARMLATLLGAPLAGAALTALAVHAPLKPSAPAMLIALVAVPVLAGAVAVAPVAAPLVVFAAFPVATASVHDALGPLHTIDLAVGGACVLAVVAQLWRRRAPLAWSPPLWWLGALVVWSLTLVPSAADRELAVKQLVALVVALAFVAVVVAVCEHAGDARVVLSGFAAATTVLAAMGLAEATAPEAHFGATVVSGRISGPFVHPGQLGSVSSLAAPVAVALAATAGRRAVRVAWGFAAALMLLALLLSYARAAWIGSMVSFAYLLPILGRARRGLAVVALAAVVALGGSVVSERLGGIVDVTVGRLGALAELSPEDQRSQIYGEAARQLGERPLTGFGPGSFPETSGRPESRTNQPWSHAHNLALTWAAETGVVGLGVVLALMLAVALACNRALRLARLRGARRDATLIAGAGAALLGFLAHGLFDYTARNLVVWFSVWALVAVVLVYRREERRAADELAHVRPRGS